MKSKKHRPRSPRPQVGAKVVGRRDFLKWAMKWIGVGVVANETTKVIDGVVDGLWWRNTQDSIAHKRVDLVERLFFDVGQSTDFIPPSNWKIMPPDVDTGGGVFTYEHEARVLDALKFFFHDVQWRVAADEDRSADLRHSLVFVGSGVSNLATRQYLGSAYDPSFEVNVRGFGCIKLPYAMAYASERQIERLQYGEMRVGPESAFIDSANQIVALPQTARGSLLEDYLLVTRVPGRTFFTGLHGPGTRATELFFREDPEMLESLEQQLHLTKGRSPYFQAIFRATDLTEKDGSVVATHLGCMRQPCPPVVLEVG